MQYKSAILKIGLRPWILFLFGFMWIGLMTWISKNFPTGAIGILGAVALLLWFLFWFDALVSKIRDIINKYKTKPAKRYERTFDK